MKWKPWKYQDFAFDKMINEQILGLFMDMGLGKTVVSLTALDYMLFMSLKISKPIIVGPKRVIEDTWPREIDKWDHLKHLRYSIIAGTEKERKQAIKADADIYLVSRDNIAWLVSFLGGAWPFDYMVIDELSSYKSHKSGRFKAVKQIRPKLNGIAGLTATPAPNSLLDLWSQLFLLDQGQRLGTTFSAYRDRYFRKKNNYTPFSTYEIIAEKDALIGEDYHSKQIYSRIGDICLSMKASDYLDLPPRVDRIVDFTLSAAVMAQYNEFEREMVLMLDEDEVTAVNAAVLTGKLRQFVAGAIYTTKPDYKELHDERIDLLRDDIEAANGNPMLIAYDFQHSRERLKHHLKEYKPRIISTPGDIKAWNDGEIRVGLMHPASGGHGLNLQDGGHLANWYDNLWSSELYQQWVGRLDRQGLKHRVTNSRYRAKGTIDEDLIFTVDNKINRERALVKAVKARIDKWRN